MALKKASHADIKKKYLLFLQIGALLTLSILVVAFRLDVNADNTFDVTLQEQEVVQMEEVVQTEQLQKPPPPPRPPVPVEVPNDVVLDEEDVIDLGDIFDVDAELPLPPPPPPVVEEVEEEPEIFVMVEQMPCLLDNRGVCDERSALADLQGEIRYPEIAKKAGVEGRVYLQFVVDENGNVQNPVVTRGIGAGCDEEALRAITTAKFQAGRQRGKAVKVKYSLAITFRLR